MMERNKPLSENQSRSPRLKFGVSQTALPSSVVSAPSGPVATITLQDSGAPDPAIRRQRSCHPYWAPSVPYKNSQDGLEAESAISPPRRSQMSLRPSQGPAHLKGSFEKLAVIVVNLANRVQVLGQEIVDRREENIRRGEWEHQERE